MEECDRAGLETSYHIQENVENVKKFVQEKGMIIHTDVDIEAFKKAGEGAYEKLNLVKVRDDIYKELGITK